MGSGMLQMETKVKASALQDAISFYHTYGNSMVYKDGWFYYGSRGKTASATQNTTTWNVVGYQVEVQSGGRTALLYFKNLGDYTKRGAQQKSGGFTYDLYQISLQGVKDKLKNVDQAIYENFARNGGSIRVNSCMITIYWNRWGTPHPSGGMYNDGSFYGAVYTNFSGIANAAPWRNKESLRSYFGKGIIYETPLHSNQIIYVRYQGVNGNYGDYEEVLNGDYLYGNEVAWSRSEDECYEYAAIRYTATVSQKKYVDVRRKQYQLSLAGDVGIDDTMGEGNYYYEQSVMVDAVIKEGYEWNGWKELEESEEKAVEFLITKDTMLLAQTKPITYQVVFHPSGGSGHMEPLQCSYDQSYHIPSITFQSPERESLFKGWTKEQEGKIVSWKEGDTIFNYTSTADSILDLYAVWDYAPQLISQDRYFTLKEAKAGVITVEELLKTVESLDEEDGSAQVQLKAFDPTYFLNLTEDSEIIVTYTAMDSSGNYVEEEATVYVIDTEKMTEQENRSKTYIRFISDKTYGLGEDEGGLEDTSIWNTNTDYREILKNLF